MQTSIINQPLVDNRYKKIVQICMNKFRNEIKLVNCIYEYHSLSIMVRLTHNNQFEYIHLRNISFYTNDEIIDQLNKKLIKLLSVQ